MRVTATEAKIRFGSLSAQSKREPICQGMHRFLTLPLKTGSLAEWFKRISKEVRIDGNDDEGEVHAGVQTRGGTIGNDGAEHICNGEDCGTVEADAAQLMIKADQQGRLAGCGAKFESPEQMEFTRLRAELARVKMVRDILGSLGKATSYLVGPAIFRKPA